MADLVERAQGPGSGAHTSSPAPASAPGAPAGKFTQPAHESEQLALLPGEDDAARDRLLPIAEAANRKPAPTGAGRPLGARNRRTDLMAEYLIGRYGDPLEAHVSLGTMPLRDLVPTLRAAASDLGLKLGMSIGDILRMQAELRRDALPYLHAKRAPETVAGEAVTPIIGIGQYVDKQVVVTGNARAIEDVIEGEQNQGVSDDGAK